MDKQAAGTSIGSLFSEGDVMIEREDMLELTRRMNLKRNCFMRIAGAYMDSDGIIDGTFNTNFRKLSTEEQLEKIAIAKEVPFAPTNTSLKEYRLTDEKMRAGSLWSLLLELSQCQLKNDALLELFYENAGAIYESNEPYCILFYVGSYDIIHKGADKVRSGDSEETYQFLIGVFCPRYGEYEPGLPECGFLYPAYRRQGADLTRVNVFRYEDTHPEILEILGLDNK